MRVDYFGSDEESIKHADSFRGAKRRNLSGKFLSLGLCGVWPDVSGGWGPLRTWLAPQCPLQDGRLVQPVGWRTWQSTWSLQKDAQVSVAQQLDPLKGEIQGESIRSYDVTSALFCWDTDQPRLDVGGGVRRAGVV